jgi:hypothetical protein
MVPSDSSKKSRGNLKNSGFRSVWEDRLGNDPVEKPPIRQGMRGECTFPEFPFVVE